MFRGLQRIGNIVRRMGRAQEHVVLRVEVHAPFQHGVTKGVALAIVTIVLEQKGRHLDRPGLADHLPELARAREQGLTQIQLRDAPDGTPVINAAAPSLCAKLFARLCPPAKSSSATGFTTQQPFIKE